MNKKEGLQLIEPNNNLALAYIKKAENSLDSMQKVTAKEWKISTAYYTSYFSLYSICMKMGIKCEIHFCTIAFAEEFLDKYLSKKDITFISNSCQVRIDTQYYIDRSVSEKEYEEILKETPLFYIKCKNILSKITEKDILKIRHKLENS